MFKDQGKRSQLYMLRGDDVEGFRLMIKRAVRAMHIRMEKEAKAQARNDHSLSYNRSGCSSSFQALQTQFDGCEKD